MFVFPQCVARITGAVVATHYVCAMMMAVAVVWTLTLINVYMGKGE